jgi:NAD(P)-dependent dehydrogenase (short-subunit alcohol dehydrogenase family)
MWKTDPFEDIQASHRYVTIEAYARAKLLNRLWTFVLAWRLEGSSVTMNATNPGIAWTPLTQALTAADVLRLAVVLARGALVPAASVG